jgi:branched-chain amino acid transport system ATP-binding protein
MKALEVRELYKRFGGIEAVAGVSLDVAPGERRVLIGPNGAGKTTLFHCIAGTHLPTAGTVTLFGKDITRLPAHARARLGLARTFQITNLFALLTVMENLLLAVAAAADVGLALIRPMASYGTLQERAEKLLADWGLAEKRSVQVRHLSYGEQRQLELALALAGSPRMLLLDEPTAGLSAAESARVVSLIQALPRDMTILMVEHDMDVAFTLAERITVLHQGRILAQGDRQAIRGNAQVAEVYLGVE